ncbi:hypothetical protein AAG570_012711 [Ranatra chinensis]|uniref:Uncharacterized protein n=1 Tax=Ranatra chinensis TaxID=642074 RepID=A0ABD0YES1_9HEMI
MLLGMFFSTSKAYIEKSFEHITYNYKLFIPDGLDLISIKNIYFYIARTYYSPWIGQLICGNFCSDVTLNPPPLPYRKITDFNNSVHKMENILEICGFIELLHLGSPAAISRHLVLPLPRFREKHSAKSKSLTSHFPLNMMESTDDLLGDDGTTPSFCVLLHGALKVENMAALCNIGNDWYGILFSWADSKKKSNLMLSVLEPGSDSVPWLGDINNLVIPPNPQPGETFPIKPPEKRSYAQNCIAWIRQTGLQSDIQKILRHARKIPDKTQHFYKELNRVRRAAICLGFISLIEGLADILERECTLLPGSAHPACAFQLTHAAGLLREPYSKDTKYNIMPMKMSFI